MSKRGIAFVLSAPAGTGKTTLVNMLADELPFVVESISCTTRKPRAGEVEGEHYHFLSNEEFLKKVEDNDFLEHANVFGNHYGTSRSFVEAQLQEGKHVFLVIDTQGALSLKDHFDAVYIFLSPPSREELKRRLVERRTEPPEVIERRLSWADEELKLADKYDYHIVNDDLKETYQQLREIIAKEERR